MADINHEIVDTCAIFTAVSDRGRAWMHEHYREFTHRYALNSDIETRQAERFLTRAKADGLDVSVSSH